MKTLDQIQNEVYSIKKAYQDGNNSLIETQLDVLFNEIKESLTIGNLNLGVDVFAGGTDLLQQKLEAITHYISFLLEKDRLVNFLKSESSEALFHQFLIHNFGEPLLFPDTSFRFLETSWNQLVFKKTKITRQPTPTLEYHEIEKELTIIPESQTTYDENMMKFLVSVQDLLPATLDHILSSCSSKDEYFENFSYLLHLLQNDYLIFDQNTRLFSPNTSDKSTTSEADHHE